MMPSIEKKVEGLGVDGARPGRCGEIHAAEDAGGMGDDGIGVGGAEIDRGEALHYVVEDLGGSLDGELEGGLVGDAGAVGVGNGDAALGGEFLDLGAGAVDEDDLDGKRPEDGDIQEDVGEVIRADDTPSMATTKIFSRTGERIGGCHGDRRLSSKEGGIESQAGGKFEIRKSENRMDPKEGRGV